MNNNGNTNPAAQPVQPVQQVPVGSVTAQPNAADPVALPDAGAPVVDTQQPAAAPVVPLPVVINIWEYLDYLMLT